MKISFYTIDDLDLGYDPKGVTGYIITHCAPNSVVKKLNPDYDLDPLTTFLEKIRRKAKFHYWLFGHYHDNKIIDERYVLLWEQIVQII